MPPTDESWRPPRLPRLAWREGHLASPNAPIDRVSAQDLVSVVTDVGSAPMQVGAVLLLEPNDSFDTRRVISVLEERIGTVPRLRQRLMAAPFGCGRPVWVDDDRFDLHQHVAVKRWPAPADEEALLRVAAEVITTRLPWDRPLWRASIVTGGEGGRVGLIVVFHHVLADGVGGLAVLADLVDGAAPAAAPVPARPRPRARELAVDAARRRVESLAALPTSLGRIFHGIRQLRPTPGSSAARCSLNRPTGPRRRFAVTRVDIEAVRSCAHASGATINDVVLGAVGGALNTLITARGDVVDQLVVSVPVSARPHTSASELGNQVDVIPIEVPCTGDATERLHVIAERTRTAKYRTRADTSVVLGPCFRLLAHLGLFSRFTNRQRFVHTFVTNLRGPDTELTLLEAPIVAAVPLAVVTGNVTVSIAVLSYAGRLTITVIADPATCPEIEELRDSIDEEFERFVAVST
jgi:WS/DGAT/MGAT family acyltransferase